MKLLQRCLGVCGALLLMAGPLCLPAAAAGGAVWGTVADQQAIVYLQGADANAEVTAQVGTTPVDVADFQPLSALDTPVQTVFLVDNSLSIPEAQRPLIKDILKTAVGNRMNGESFTLATMGESLTYLCQGETDYIKLTSLIDGIENVNQVTQLTDCLYTAVTDLQNDPAPVLRRLVVVSDGVDDQELGYTHNELTTLLGQAGYPLYALGCGSDDPGLQELFALTRIAGGGSAFPLGQAQDAASVAVGLADWNNAVRVVIPLPDEMCDGTVRALRLANAGEEYTCELKMPFATMAAATEPPAEPPTEPPAPDIADAPAVETAPPVVQAPAVAPEPAPGLPLPLILAAAAAAVVVVVVVVVVVLRRKKPKAGGEAIPPAAPAAPVKPAAPAATEAAAPAPAPAPAAPDYDPLGATQALGSSRREADGDATESLWGAAAPAPSRQRMLVLTNLQDPSERYEMPLTGMISIGRDPAVCQIVLQEPAVARHQCDIFMQDGRVVLRNQGRVNPSVVDGRPVTGEETLPDGCVLRLGRLDLRVEVR